VTAGAAEHRGRERWLWAALAAGFSPVLVDLARSLRETDASWLVLLAPALLASALWLTPPRRSAPRRDGLLLVALGALLEWLGVAGASASIARIGLPVAALGLARALGSPPLGILALAFFAVPLPGSIGNFATPVPESLLAAGASRLLRTLGAQLESVGPVLSTPAQRLELTPGDNGLDLALELAAFGWYSAAREAAPLLSHFARAALAGTLSLLLQPAAVVLAALLLLAGAPQLAQSWLGWGVALLTALGAFAWIERRARAAS
jgi:hypothetical protein